jgi:hypothetical protein
MREPPDEAREQQAGGRRFDPGWLRWIETMRPHRTFRVLWGLIRFTDESSVCRLDVRWIGTLADMDIIHDII